MWEPGREPLCQNIWKLKNPFVWRGGFQPPYLKTAGTNPRSELPPLPCPQQCLFPWRIQTQLQGTERPTVSFQMKKCFHRVTIMELSQKPIEWHESSSRQSHLGVLPTDFSNAIIFKDVETLAQYSKTRNRSEEIVGEKCYLLWHGIYNPRYFTMNVPAFCLGCDFDLTAVWMWLWWYHGFILFTNIPRQQQVQARTSVSLISF